MSVTAPVVVLLIGGALTAVAWRSATQAEQRDAQRSLDATLNLIEVTIRDRLLTYETALHAGAGLMAASPAVSANEWRQFAQQLSLARSYPGLQAVAFTRRTQSEDPSRGVERDQTEIVFIEPLDERNRRALGFDMMSEPVRRHAMQRARDTGTASLSGKVTLVQEITTDKQAGFLMYLPVFGQEAPRSIEQRRQSLVGFVYCPFRAADFLNTVLRGVAPDVHVEVFDLQSSNDDGGWLFSSMNSKSSVAPHTINRSVELLGARWLLQVTPLADFYATRRSTAPEWTAVGGGAATALFTLLVWMLALSRQHLAGRLLAEQLASQRERHSAAFLENSLDVYVGIDADDRIVEWNRQAATVFGWSKREVMGKRLADTIVPPQHQSAHLAAIQNFDARAHTLLGRRIEMPACRRDGTELTVELSIFATTQDQRRLFIASLRDVTEQHRQRAEIVALNATLEQRVQERTEALHQANTELHSANTQLEAFAQNVSHDLRAPLRAAEGYAAIVLEGCGNVVGTSNREHIAAISSNLRRMQHLIDGLLKLAMIGRQPVERRMVDLWSLVLSAIDDLQIAKLPAIQAAPEALGEVFADPNLLQHALRNLLSNAVKFSRNATEPRIWIGAEIQGGERVFFVRDNGVGFSEELASRLFKAFHRLHRTEEFEGTGIGLTIVKNVVEKHGGRIWARSAPGEGATFFFTLPGR